MSSSSSDQSDQSGRIVIISSPSGGGKTTICNKLLEKHNTDGWTFSVSATTRPKRPNEEDGREYFFKERSEFEEMERNGEFAESCFVHGYHYGTPRSGLEKTLEGSGVILLDIDYQGAEKIMSVYPDALSIFVFPPTRAELERRLTARATESEEDMKVRLKGSLNEMKHYENFKYWVINDNLEGAIRAVDCIIEAPDDWKGNPGRERIREIIG